MFKRIPKKIATVLLGGIMLCSGIGMLSVSAAEETFVDDCNDLNKIFDSMKVEATGESVWEVIECPYVQGEKFIQRKELRRPVRRMAGFMVRKAVQSKISNLL